MILDFVYNIWSFHLDIHFLFFLPFARCHSNFISPSCLISHPAFIFFIRILSGNTDFITDLFRSAKNDLIWFSLLGFLLNFRFLTRFLRDDNIVFFSAMIFSNSKFILSSRGNICFVVLQFLLFCFSIRFGSSC